MNKPRPRRARQRQSSSQIPVRSSSNEQSQKTIYCVRADGSGGEITTDNSTQVICSSQSNSSSDESRKMAVHHGESRDDGRVYIKGGLNTEEKLGSPRCTSGNEKITSRSFSGDGKYEKTVYHLRAGSDGDGVYNEGTEKIVCKTRDYCGDGDHLESVYDFHGESDGEGVYTNENSKNEESVIYTSRSDDGEITTVRQTFKIVGTIDQDNRCSKESLNSNVDSAFHGSLDFLDNLEENEKYSSKRITKAVSFEDVGSDSVSKLWIKPTDNIKLEIEQEVGQDEELLREELLRIFDRERLTLGSFFKNKMEDMARDCRQRELDVEEHSRAELAEMESDMAREKAEMQKVFAEEIAALTRTFNEDRASIESYYKGQIKELREQHASDQREINQKFALEKTELKEKLESEFEAVLRTEIGESRKLSLHEINQKEELHNTAKLEMERKHGKELQEAEMNTKKVKDELEMMFSQEKARLEERIRDLEHQLLQEREMRIQLESLLEEEKENVKNVDNAKRSEAEQLKYELEGLKVELDEKTRTAIEMSRIEEEIRTNGKNGLSGKLREDVDKIIDEHKQEFERKYLLDREELQRDKERQLEEEKKKIKDDVEYEKKKIQDDVENERKKMREEIDRERQEIQIYLKNGRAVDIKQSEESFTKQSEHRTSVSYSQGDQDQNKTHDKDESQTNNYGTYSSFKGDVRVTDSQEYTSHSEREPDQRKTQYNPAYGHDENMYASSAKREAVHETYASHSIKSGVYSSPNHDYPGQRGDRGEPNKYDAEIHVSLQKPDGRRNEPNDPDQLHGSSSQFGKSYQGQAQSRDLPGQQPEGRGYDNSEPQSYPNEEQWRCQSEYGQPHQGTSRDFLESKREYDGTSQHDDHPHDYSQRKHGHQSDRFHPIDERGDTSRYQSSDQVKSTQSTLVSEQYYVTPGNENDLRTEINQLRSENEGLKAKIEAMEENIDLHKKYKSEAKDELTRLQKTKDELQSRLDKGSKDDEDAKKAKLKADKLEKSLKESEARRKEFEARIKELKSKLSDAESKAKQTKDKTDDLEERRGEHTRMYGGGSGEDYKTGSYKGHDKYSQDATNDGPTALESCPLYTEHSSFGNPDKYGKTGGQSDKDTKQENVYGYPAELSQSLDFLDYKSHVDTGTGYSHRTKKEPEPSWKNSDTSRGKYAKSSQYTSKHKSATRPGASLMSSPHPIHGSHERLGRRDDKHERTGYEPGRYSSFGVGNDSGFNTSSPRKLDGRSYGNEGTLTSSSANKENYEKAVAERNKLVQLIKQLKLKVEELYSEKERIDKEESKMRSDPIEYKSFGPRDGLSSSEHADLKAKVEDMQRKIRALAERLKRDSPRGKHISYDQNDNYTSTPSMQDIEYLQDKLQRTGDAISHTHGNSDPGVLLRIENEVKAIGELIKKHCQDYEQGGGSSFRSDGDNVKMVQLQMEKQELEMKLNMAKEAMNDYVSRLSDKMEGLEESNALSDATLQELYERNAKLKETLKALEKGQQRSQRQNEALRHQTSALQNVIGQICKSSDTSFCSQYSTPRQTGSHGYSMTSQGHSTARGQSGSHGYSMTSQSHSTAHGQSGSHGYAMTSQGHGMEISDRFRSY